MPVFICGINSAAGSLAFIIINGFAGKRGDTKFRAGKQFTCQAVLFHNRQGAFRTVEKG